jgi:hypothetical protein
MYCVLKVSDFESRQKQDFFLLQNVGTSFGARPSSYSMGTDVLSRGESGRAVKLTSDTHLVLKLGMSRFAILLRYVPTWHGPLFYCKVLLNSVILTEGNAGLNHKNHRQATIN